MSNDDGNLLSLPIPTITPFTHAIATLSADPTRSSTRRPFHPDGTVNVRRYRPVGLWSGTSGGSPPKGMTTLV